MRCFAQKLPKPIHALQRTIGKEAALWPAVRTQPGPSADRAVARAAERSSFEPRFAHELARVVQQGGSPGVIQGQKSPRDLKKILKDPCFGERVDDTKKRCQFSDRQSRFVRIIKEHALRKCARAVAAINMPGNEDRVKTIAKDYFHLNIRLTEKTRRTLINTIKAISDSLEKSPIECGTCQDEHCNRGLVAYADGRTSIVLCPPFFMDEIYKVPLTPGFLIHEAAHLAGVNTPSRDELYCHEGATKEDKCPVVDAIHNADAWAHFIDQLSYTI